MELDTTVVAAFIGTSGVLITAILSSAGYFYKSWTEHKKSTRKVLYLLLELRHAILSSLFDPNEATEEYITHYTDRVRSKGIPADREDISSNLKDLVNEHFVNVVHAIKTDIEARLLSPFENALFEMASVVPVLAYQIRGKEKIEKLITQTKIYQNNLKSEVIDNIEEKWLKDVLEETTIEFQEEALKELSAILDKDVLRLAKGCGWLDHLKCKKELARGLNYKNKYDFEELDIFIDKFLEKIEDAAKKEFQRMQNLHC